MIQGGARLARQHDWHMSKQSGMLRKVLQSRLYFISPVYGSILFTQRIHAAYSSASTVDSSADSARRVT